MRYDKPFLTLDQQAQQLVDRGLGDSPDAIRRRLESVNYYRLSAYWHTFRDGHRFKPNTDFAWVWERYTFDRELRVLVLDALERFEVAVRTRLAYEHGQKWGAFGYATDPTALYEFDPRKRTDFLRRLAQDIAQDKNEDFIRHFRDKYSQDHDHPPVWVAVEILTFGGIVTLYRGTEPRLRKAVADYFGLPDAVLQSWLMALNIVRNICAHHGRLWNREQGLKVKIPRHRDWATPVAITSDRIFGVMTILAYLMHRLAPGSRWPGRMRELMAAHPELPRQQMGFPEDWQDSTIWKRAWNEV